MMHVKQLILGDENVRVHYWTTLTSKKISYLIAFFVFSKISSKKQTN